MADTTRTTSGFASGTAHTPQSGSGAGGAVPASSGTGHAGQGHGSQGHGGDSTLHSMTEGAEQAISEAKKVGSELVGAVRESAVSLLDQQRTRAADQVASIGDALRRSAHSFDGIGADMVVRYGDQAAEQITGFADTLRDRSWAELADDVEGFARRWPVAFMASAVGIGFLAGRFMLSSAERARHDSVRRGSGGAKPAFGTQQSHQGGTRHQAGGSHIGGSHIGTSGGALPGSPKPGHGTSTTRE